MRNSKKGSDMQMLEDKVKVEPAMNRCHEPEPSARQACGGVEGSPASGLSGQDADNADRSAAISIDLGRTEAERTRALERYKELERWIWNEQTQEASSLRAFRIRKKREQDLLSSCQSCHEFYWPRDKHCPCCHGTFDSSSKVHAKFLEHTRECEELLRTGDSGWKQIGPSASHPSRFQLLKAGALAIEVLLLRSSSYAPSAKPEFVVESSCNISVLAGFYTFRSSEMPLERPAKEGLGGQSEGCFKSRGDAPGTICF